MPDDFAPQLDTAARLAAESLVVDVDGFEGPLDVLLMLSRTQKVDLRKISVLALAEQYLAFVEEVRRLRIELAADYLVMAAWLAYLKSRLLLPPPHEDGDPSGEELAAHLAFQLERLEAMRRAAAQLMGRDQLGRDFFARGEETTVTVTRKVSYDASLLDLLKAYSRIKTREDFQPLHMKRGPIFTMEQALERLRPLIGAASSTDWASLERYLPEGWALNPKKRRSALASSFAALLELAKEGKVELRQETVFAPLQLRRRAGEG